jgi:hypothetical protein
VQPANLQRLAELVKEPPQVSSPGTGVREQFVGLIDRGQHGAAALTLKKLRDGAAS